MDAKSNEGYTPAHLAAGCGQTETLIALLKRKPELWDATTKAGVTLAHIAKKNGHKNTVRALTEMQSQYTSTKPKPKQKKRSQPSSTTRDPQKKRRKKGYNADSNTLQSAIAAADLFSINTSKQSQNTSTRPERNYKKRSQPSSTTTPKKDIKRLKI